MKNNIKLLTRKEYEDWIRGLPDGYCPFCDSEANAIVLGQTKNWLWIANRSPYWKYHTMFIPKKHYVEFDELDIELLQELQYIYKKAINKYRELYQQGIIDIERRYLMFWRFREEAMDIKSGLPKSNHLHIHLVPDRERLFDKILDETAVDVDIRLLQLCD